MPLYLLNAAGWQALWPPPLCAVVVTALLFPALPADKNRNSGIASVFALALLGVVTGMMTGMSRDPAVGTVLPAVLSLVAGLSLYLLGVQPANTRHIAACVIALALCLLIGSFWGSELRQIAVDEEEAAVEARDAFRSSAEARVHDADVELFIRQYRARIGLPISENDRDAAAVPIQPVTQSAQSKKNFGHRQE